MQIVTCSCGREKQPGCCITTAMNKRFLIVVLTVLLLHIGLIGGLLLGKSTSRLPAYSPVMVVSQAIKIAPPAQAIPTPDTLPQQTKKKTVAKAGAVAISPTQPAADREAPAIEASNNVPVQIAVPPASVSTGAAGNEVARSALAQATSPAQADVQLPLSDADYLHNPRPHYPSTSQRLNEQGRTTVRVLIGTNGLAERAEIAKSSGYKRLDDAAINTVMRWRYVPGKRGGVAESMWFDVPINWTLN
jgi:protein TonB